MIKESDNTKSFQLFIEFCKINKIHCCPIDTTNKRTPDLDIYFDNRQIYTEIVQFDSSDIQFPQSGIKLGFCTYWSKAENRVRHKITKCKKQLKQRILDFGENPTLIVMYDNTKTNQIDYTDIKCAMYGKESVDVFINNDSKEIIGHSSLYLGKSKKMTANTNTSISALSLLFENAYNELELSIFLNQFAKSPINPDWLRIKPIKYFELSNNHWTLL